MTRDSALEFLGEVTVAPITTTIREIPTEVILTTVDGMPRECVINLAHVQTVSSARIGPLLTTLDGRRLAEVRDALFFALGIDGS